MLSPVCSLFSWDPRVILYTVVQYCAQGAPMPIVDVPGDARQCRTVSGRVTNAFAALVCWTDRLHSLGYCMNGPLNENHFVVLCNGSVKGTRDLFDMLVNMNEGLRANNMAWLALFARDNLYQPILFGPVPPDVQHLFDIMSNFTPAMYILVKSHPALEDAIGKSALFCQHYGQLKTLSRTDPNQFRNILGNIHIDNLAWISRAVQNSFLQQLMRFKSSVGPLRRRLRDFLCSQVNCGVGGVWQCLKLRRDGEAHLLQDYCHGDHMGTLEAFSAAQAAVLVRNPQLANLPPNPRNFGVWQPHLGAPFFHDEAEEIADVIMDALARYRHSSAQATAAAIAAARHVAALPHIYSRHAPTSSQSQVQRYLRKYRQMRRDAAAAATAAAAALQVQAPLVPIVARNLFDVRDVANFFELTEPNLLSELHRAMFDAQQLQGLAWHYGNDGRYLPM